MKSIRAMLTDTRMKKYLILAVFIMALMAVFSALSPAFLSVRTIMNLIVQTSSLMIISLGMTFVIMMANTDLSVGSQLALCGVIGAITVSGFPENSAIGAATGIAAALGAGVLCGAFNGFMVGVCGVSPFMTTLATMQLFRGIALVLCGDARVAVNNAIFNGLAQKKFGSLPLVAIVLFLLIAATWVLLNKTSFGRKTYAVGGNATAARIAGIHPGLHTMLVYAFTGLMCGIAAIITVGRTVSAQPLAGKNLEFEVITAVVLGGTSLAGGVGTIAGTVLGGLLVGLMSVGLSMLDISIAVNYLLKGAMILIAVYTDIFAYNNSLKAAGREVRQEAKKRSQGGGSRERTSQLSKEQWSSTLELRHITKVFPGVRALDDVSITIKRGKVLALVGENGAGKSTLMKILSGVYTRDDGEILADGVPVEIRSPADAQRLGISVIYQELALVPEMPVYNNVFLGREPPGRSRVLLDNSGMRKRTRELLNKFGLSINVGANTNKYTVGQRQMMEIVRAVDSEAFVVVMDEPTASITNADKDKLFETIRSLRDSGVAVVYISHRMSEIFEIADEVAVLRDGRHIVTAPIGEVDEKLLIRYMVDRELSNIYGRGHLVPGKTALEVRNLTRKGAFYDVSFELHEGEVLGFSGLIGAGRSEIMRCIFGLDKPDSGEIYLYGEKVRIKSPREAIQKKLAFVTEDRRGEGIVPKMGVGDNITLPVLRDLCNLGWIDAGREAKIAEEFVERLQIKTPSLDQQIGNLSGGNQQKCCLAKWLATEPRVIILDEPTKGIDVGAKAEIHRIIDQLARDGFAVIIISSELPEIIGACDNIIVMYEGRVTGRYSAADTEITQDLLMTSASGIAI